MAIIDEFTQDELAELFEYLDALRVTGVTNMFGAAPYLTMQFGLDEAVAKGVLASWMQTFDAKVPALARVNQLKVDVR